MLLNVLVNPCMKRRNGIVYLWCYGVSVQEIAFFLARIGYSEIVVGVISCRINEPIVGNVI